MSLDAILVCSFVAFAAILVGIFVLSLLVKRRHAAGARAQVATPPAVSPEDPAAADNAATGGLFSMVGAPSSWITPAAQASKEPEDKGQIQSFHQDKAEMHKDARSRGAPEMRVDTMGVNEHQNCWSCGC